jgi:hypothetical protein
MKEHKLVPMIVNVFNELCQAVDDCVHLIFCVGTNLSFSKVTGNERNANQLIAQCLISISTPNLRMVVMPVQQHTCTHEEGPHDGGEEAEEAKEAGLILAMLLLERRIQFIDISIIPCICEHVL